MPPINPQTAAAAVAAATTAEIPATEFPPALLPQSSLSSREMASQTTSTPTTQTTPMTRTLRPSISALLGQLPQTNFPIPAAAAAAAATTAITQPPLTEEEGETPSSSPLVTTTTTPTAAVPAMPLPPLPPPPRTRHRSHQNIITCDGNWQFHSCPSRFGLAALIAQMMYVLCFQAGASPVPWVVAAEIFPTDVRGAASGLAAMANWSANLIVSAIFPAVFRRFGGSAAFGTLFIFTTAAWLYAWIALPETRGLSAAEIGAAMRVGDGGGGGGGGSGGGDEGGLRGVNHGTSGVVGSGGAGRGRSRHVEVTRSTSSF